MTEEASDPLYTAVMEGSLYLNSGGRWIHDGIEVTHPGLISFLHRSISWDDSLNKYVIRYGKGRATFTYENTVYFVKQIITETDPWQIQLMDDSIESLKPEELAVDNQNRIYCPVKKDHYACLLSSPHQQLLCHAVSDTELAINGKTCTLSPFRTRHE